ncbi:DMT family transporter [Stutzerimonas balearica]|uniref:DMT family transporter n=1 Tax=Stutzerimonas balearica TaxID=74829 RepID=UPI00190C4D65|nr:DMT family transporter [Stutzerimonas balearica]MBK3749193.1 EamA family transporter [Stutzerimonas balearica]MBK3827390.1 EamA family transporter [Stutzerimonas balearica]MBK3857080.1 EamA family transporter [Stutzerimonas balearica]
MNDNNHKAVAPSWHQAWLWPALFSLLAFAANSIFCRLALTEGGIDPQSFTVVRLASGALFLWLLTHRRRSPSAASGSWKGGLALFLYAYLFSVAYVELGAGVGALILFGAVQLTMFAWAWLKGERVRANVLIGMLIAFAGLIALLLPGANTPALGSSLLMLVAGAAWGAYSLIGRGSTDPVADTTGNFARSLVFLPGLALLLAWGEAPQLGAAGLLYAVASGALASGAGYVVWYGVVKRISAQQAATLQLSVPILAALGGVLLLGEPMSVRLLATSAAVLGGVALALLPRRQPAA